MLSSVLNHKLFKNVYFEKVHLVFQEIMMLQTNLLYEPLKTNAKNWVQQH